MKNSKRILLLWLPVFLLTGLFIAASDANAQRRDHLTDEETDLIRFHQEVDKRMEVYIKAIERRFMVMNGTENLSPKQQKRVKKDLEKWGDLPKGDQTQMLEDIEKIIDEAINKIDDVASRDMKSKLFPKAVHKLADAARGFIPRLEKIASETKKDRELAVISSSLDYCRDIIEASTKVKRPEKGKRKKGRS